MRYMDSHLKTLPIRSSNFTLGDHPLKIERIWGFLGFGDSFGIGIFRRSSHSIYLFETPFKTTTGVFPNELHRS